MPSLADPEAPLWATKWQSGSFIEAIDAGEVTTGSVYYDYTIPAQRSDYDDWCIPPAPGAVLPWGCSFLILEEGIYIVAPNNPDPAGQCCFFIPDLAPSSPDWIQTQMEFAGQEDFDGVVTNKWEGGGHYYWSDAADGSNIAFAGENPLGMSYIHYITYEEGVANPPGFGFSLPTDLGDCSDACFA